MSKPDTVILLNPGDHCQHEGCDRPAVRLAAEDQHSKPGRYCSAHAFQVHSHGDPRADAVGCPNCGCWFGVD